MLFKFGGLFRKVWRVALILGALVIGTNTVFVAPVYAATGINQQLNFQGRLLNAQGAVAPDGNYNVEFKIYQDGTGTVAGNPSGTLKWTEDWLNSASHTVQVLNGYISVQLGSVNAFGNSIDWNQDTLWLSVNIGNTSSCTITTNFTADCGGDGEMLPMKRLSAVPYSLNSAKLGGLTAAGFIQNTTTVQTTANLAIDGTARADTSILTPTVDTNTAVALNIGTTNATAINLNKNVTVAAGKTLTLAGDTRANITANITAPAEGAMVYDTTNHKMLTWNGTKWVNSGSDAYLVAANNSSQADKDAADYVATGTGDQSTIQSALDRADPASAVSGARKSGKVYLFAGTYTTNDVISIKNNTTLAGSGRGSIIKFADIHGQTKNMITNSDTSTGTGVTVRDLQLDGSNSVNTSGTMHGIYFNGMGNGSGSGARQGANIINNWVNNFFSNGILLNSSPNSTIIGNNVQGNTSNGLYISSSNRSNITNNISQGNGGSGIVLGGAIAENVVANTFAKNNTAGIYINGGSNNNSIVGNNLYSNGNTDNNAIYFPLTVSPANNSSFNTITNNTINDDSTTASNYAININDPAANKNYLADNVFTSTAGTSSINDAPANNTVYANQPRGEAGAQLTNRTANDTQAFTIQKADGTNVLTVDTANSKVLVAGTLDTTTATQLNIGTTTANAISIGNGTITTTIVGYTGVTLNATTGTTMVCRNGTGLLSACDATYLTPTGSNFILNSTALQATSNFHVSGTGQADTALITPSIRAVTDGTAAIKLQNTAGTVTALTVDTTNNRVGIGTATTPASTLHVGVNNASATATTALLEQQGSGNTTLQLKNASESWNMGIDSSDGNAFKITTANAAATNSTFGNSTAGNLDNSDDNNFINAGKYTAGVTGNAVSLSVYVACSLSTSPNNQFRMALFSDSGAGTTPSSLLAQSAAGTLVSGWNQISIPATAVTSGTLYWIAYNSNGTNVSNNCFRTTTGAGANANVWTSSYTFGSMPASWPGNAGNATASPNFYATVQTSAGTNTYTNALLQMTNSGRFTLHNSLDSTSAFQVQNAAGTSVLNVDSTNSKVLIAGTLDTTTAATLNIGTTSATAINLNQNVTVAATKTLRIAGDTRTNITAIGAPTEGMMTYDTTNHQMLQWNGTKWVNNGSDAYLVAANNSSQADKDAADYIATGTADQTPIQNALDRADPASGTAGARKSGKVYLFAGTYNLSGVISIQNNITLSGSGAGTLLTIPNAQNGTYSMITNANTGAGTGVSVQDLTIDGNKAGQTSGAMAGVLFSGMGAGSGTTARPGGKITNVVVKNMYGTGSFSSGAGITLTGSSNNVVTGNKTEANGNIGIGVTSSSNYNTVSNNVAQGNTSYGISLNSPNNTISGNIVQGNTSNGIYLSVAVNNNVVGNTISGNGANGVRVSSSSPGNTFSGNSISSNTQEGLYLNGVTTNTVTGNTFIGNTSAITLDTATYSSVTGNTITSPTVAGITLSTNANNNTISGNAIFDAGGTANNGIYISTSSYNTITGNNIGDTSGSGSNYAINIFNNTSLKNYLSNNTFSSTLTTASINDPAGTGTIYANQARTENGGQLTNRTTNDAAAFTFQKADGTNVLTVDTTNSKVLVAGVVDTTTATTLSLGTATANAISIGSVAAGTAIMSNTITIGSATATPANTNSILGAAQTNAATAGNAMVIQGSTGLNGNGGTVTLQGGNANGTGTLGGNLTLAGGTGSTSNGAVILATSTFQTATTDANCFPSGTERTTNTDCTFAQGSVNNNASVIAGFTNDGRIAIMPDPSIVTAGRVVYVTASGATKDFTLRANSGAGLGIEQNIAMRKNTTATMIWNGADWTAAGASSSTTMQAAYDNTLQSAGGAELIVSKTAATNGLTIRDTTGVNAVNGALLNVQSGSAANLFSVNSNVVEYTSNSGAETYSGTTTAFPASTWTALTGSTVTRQDVAGNYIATGQGSVKTVTTAVGNTGVKNQLVNSAGAATALNASTTYNVSFTTRLLSGTFTDMNVYYSVDGSVASVSCLDGLTPATSATSSTSVWTKVNCTFTTPASALTSANAILIRQTGGTTARTFYIDNLSVTIAADYNFATDGDAGDTANFGTNWVTAGLGTVAVSQFTGDGYDASNSAQGIVSVGAANAGIRNKLSSNPLPSTLYRVTVYAKSSNAFTDFKIRYSRDGSTTAGGNYVDCVDYNTQTISTSLWTKVTCYITTDATTATNPYVYFAETASATRTFYVDAFSMTLRTSTTPNVQVGGGVNGGPTTLLTLDKGASAPIASDNDALLGSMYYDTTLGKLQCYEADGWGACGSSPDTVVTISPEFNNAVMHGTGIGTMTSDICSDTLNINDSGAGTTICGTNETYNFYKWTSPQSTGQVYSIYVTYQLPSTFKEFASGQTSVMGRTDSANSIVSYQIYRSNSTSGLTPCGSSVGVSSGVQTTWLRVAAAGAADPSTCGFVPNDSIVFKINMTASGTSNAYVGNLNFIFSNR